MADARAAAIEAWLAGKGWTPFRFQRETWSLIRAGRSGLVHATTGAGKTLAVALGAWLAFGAGPRPLIRPADAGHLLPEGEGVAPLPEGEGGGRRPRSEGRLARPDEDGLTLLWITPMRALAADTERALHDAFEGVAAQAESNGPAWTVGARTGDTSQSERARQAKRPPRVLITTPESLSLMLSRPDARETFTDLRCVVVDEWHELIGNKRGVLTQLGLARLGAFRPGLMTWGMSATLGNLDEALRVLLGPRAAGQGAMVEAKIDKAARRRYAHSGFARAFPLGRASRDQDGRGGGGRDRSGQEHTHLHQRPLADRALVSELARDSGPTGPGSSRSITARFRARRATGSSMA